MQFWREMGSAGSRELGIRMWTTRSSRSLLFGTFSSPMDSLADVDSRKLIDSFDVEKTVIGINNCQLVFTSFSKSNQIQWFC